MIKGLVDIPLIRVYDTIDEVKWEKLPKEFVIKTDLGCSGILVKCLQKIDNGTFYDTLHYKKLKIIDIIKFYKANENYGKILIEKYLKDKSQGNIPYDFKIMVAYNELLFVRVINRNWRPRNKHAILDAKLKRIPNNKWWYPRPKIWDLDRTRFPKELKKATELAVKIAIKIEAACVSVDCFFINGKIYVGELTFTPGGLIFEYMKEDKVNFIKNKIDSKIKLIKEMRDLPPNI